MFLSVSSWAVCYSAELRLPSVFSDHMILQCDRPVPVWGRAAPETVVTVAFSGQRKETRADAGGTWSVELDPLRASFEPCLLTVQNGDSKIVCQDVLVGEVWLCSGQSNMEIPMEGWPPKFPLNDSESEIAAAAYPRIRLYHTPRKASNEPVSHIDSRWVACTPETARHFSAVAYYFGRKLHQELQIPVGLLQSAWSGTSIEPWIPPCAIKGNSSLADLQEKLRNMPVLGADPERDRYIPTALYNGMIHAHIPFPIRGAIWYQGESNRRDGMLYVDKTRALLAGWRALWGYDFPFYFVQITPFQYGNEDPEVLPAFWEAQSAIVKNIPKTGMAVINDLPALHNAHPPNKKEPGIRLALLALNHTYGRDLVSSGPVYSSLEPLGDKLNVSFDSADGLTTRDGKDPNWFEIAGSDGVFFPAQAAICGTGVLLSSPDVADPVRVRFAWSKRAVPNLINSAGLPAGAFRAEYSPIHDLKREGARP